MKLLLVATLLVLLFTPAFGQLSDKTGLVNRLEVETAGHTFEVEAVANFDVTDHEFVANEKRLTIFISSGLENNFGELIIPRELLGGNLTFALNDQDYVAKYRSNGKISFVTLNFTGNGTNKLDVFGTEVLPNVEVKQSESAELNGGGCLIATAAYGSEMAPQIQFLREIRDGKVMSTGSGAAFMTGFNQFYYSFSPTVADYERENPAFKEMVKIGITPMLASLSILSHANIDSEQEMLGYGIGIILMNLGMYFAAPVVFLFVIKNHLKKH